MLNSIRAIAGFARTFARAIGRLAPALAAPLLLIGRLAPALAFPLLLIGRLAPALAVPLLVASPAHADSPLYEFAAPAEWVDVVAPQYDAPAGTAVADGASVLLYDRQIDVTAEGDEYYERFAVRVLNSVGVDAWSQASFSVDPTFQSLTIHWLRIVRDGKVIDQRELARITAVPEESDLRNRIYNGRYNVDVLFADVRAGDVIDYAYSLSSRERLFPGHFAVKLYTGWSDPVHHQRIRIRSPLDRPLRFRLSNSEVPPEPEIRGNLRELVLEWTDPVPIAGDPDRPGWYDPWPYLEVTDLESWSDVSRLAAPLFSVPRSPGARVKEVVAEIGAAGGTLEEQALRALQFVQDEISYASISIGRGTHEPADPDTVLQRRYGDCKDKALLLATLLERLGIEAQPALVHSTAGRALDEALPTPYAFDHAITWARIGDGVYWLDGTAATQYSPLSTDRPADFERALLVETPSPELEIIPQPATDTRRREVVMEFDLRDGIEEPASLTMTTRFAGRLADTMRPVLLRGTPEQRKVDYANYIASYYPGATPAAPIAIEDDKSKNVIEIREYYTLPRTFTADDDGALTFFLHTDEIYRYSDSLDSSVRQAPLALEYPIEVRESLIVHLPEPWPIDEETVTVENPAFRYESDVSYAGNTLKLEYEYEALADHVSPAQLAQYEKDRRLVYDDTGYKLWYDPTVVAESNDLAPLPVAIVLLTAAFSVWAAIRWGWRYDPESRETRPGAPVGIRGWLLLPALGVVVTPFVLAWASWAWSPFLIASRWEVLPSIVGEAWSSTAQAVVLAFLATGVLLMVGSILSAVLFFRKRTSAPAFFIALNWLTVGWAAAILAWTYLAGLLTGAEAEELVVESFADLIALLLWTLYMRVSHRVNATFVNRAPPRAAGSLLAAAAAP